MTKIRDFFRRLRIQKHMRHHGPIFEFHGLSITLPENVDIGAANSLLKNRYEKAEAEIIKKFLPKDVPVIELGGSLGVISRLIRSQLDEGVQHIIVEANETILETCISNAKINNHDLTELRHAAIDYHHSQLSFPVSGNVHSNRVGAATDGAKTMDVNTITLNDLWSSMGKPKHYSLVCDIEGAEYDMVMKDSQVIEKAVMIIMELHPNFYDAGTAALHEITRKIEALGFDRCAEYGDVIGWRKNTS